MTVNRITSDNTVNLPNLENNFGLKIYKNESFVTENLIGNIGPFYMLILGLLVQYLAVLRQVKYFSKNQ